MTADSGNETLGRSQAVFARLVAGEMLLVPRRLPRQPESHSNRSPRISEPTRTVRTESS